MNLLSYGGTLKLVIGWQKKKKKWPNSPEMLIQLLSSSKSELSGVGAHFSGKSLSLQGRTLASGRPDFLLVVKTGSSHPDRMLNCGQAARLHGYC